MQKTDYSNFDLGDFAADEYFVEWVLRPDQQSDTFWSQWQSEHPSQEKILHEARLTVLLMQSRKIRMHESQKENLWQRIQQETTEKVSSENKSNSRFFMYAAAACFTLVAFVFGGMVYMNRDAGSHEVIAKNAPGKTSVIYLEDGTKVWLNADSKLSYQESFQNASTRIVRLEGEAFFDVAEDKTKPFIVQAQHLQVKVLGTAFNVRAFSNENKIETTLLRGRVEASSLKDNGAPVLLSPNQQAVWDEKSQRLLVQEVDADKIASWREGVLIFDNTPFAEVKVSLERRYGVTITLEDEQSLQCRFSGVVKNEPINEVLALLQTTSKITYEIKGTAVTVKGSLCQQSSPSP